MFVTHASSNEDFVYQEHTYQLLHFEHSIPPFDTSNPSWIFHNSKVIFYQDEST